MAETSRTVQNVLRATGLYSDEALARIGEERAKNPEMGLTEAVLKFGGVREAEFLRRMGELLGFDYVELEKAQPRPDVLQKLPASAVYQYNVLPLRFADGVLPRIHISGCTSSCGTHQSAQIGLQGTVKLVDQKPQPAYVLSAGGCDQQGKETFGKVIGTILESDLIAFFTKLGTTISAAQETYETWIRDHGEEFAALAAEYTR